MEFSVAAHSCTSIVEDEQKIVQCGDEDNPLSNVVLNFSGTDVSQKESRTQSIYFNTRILKAYDADPADDTTALDLSIGIYAGLGKYFSVTRAFPINGCTN